MSLPFLTAQFSPGIPALGLCGCTCEYFGSLGDEELMGLVPSISLWSLTLQDVTTGPALAFIQSCNS